MLNGSSGLFMTGYRIGGVSGALFPPIYNLVLDAHLPRDRPILDLIKIEIVKAKLYQEFEYCNAVIGIFDWYDLINESDLNNKHEIKFFSNEIVLSGINIKTNRGNFDEPSRYINIYSQTQLPFRSKTISGAF